ncbi:hypothetical protein SKAU_G00023920 [Synaphobranchus kaupii]|uniref:Uncharacterized protein n=1 Tax=Synaphobranchus kaupii TaxID=118154 RepID=A0A9Q1JEX8_SYNKA|nr:hypothetical protein SKAU_G00023920 [Synaphobranchus kaupii]
MGLREVRPILDRKRNVFEEGGTPPGQSTWPTCLGRPEEEIATSGDNNLSLELEDGRNGMVLLVKMDSLEKREELEKGDKRGSLGLAIEVQLDRLAPQDKRESPENQDRRVPKASRVFVATLGSQASRVKGDHMATQGNLEQ